MLVQDLLDQSSALGVVQLLFRLVEQGFDLLVAVAGKVVAAFFEIRLTASIGAIGFIGIGLEIAAGDLQGVIAAPDAGRDGRRNPCFRS